jgi:sulfate adenylyltransferase
MGLSKGVDGAGGKVQGLALPERVFPCATPAQVRETLPEGEDVLAFQCRNPIHRAHYELFIRALEAPNVGKGAVCLVHPTCGPTQVRSPWFESPLLPRLLALFFFPVF